MKEGNIKNLRDFLILIYQSTHHLSFFIMKNHTIKMNYLVFISTKEVSTKFLESFFISLEIDSYLDFLNDMSLREVLHLARSFPPSTFLNSFI